MFFLAAYTKISINVLLVYGSTLNATTNCDGGAGTFAKETSINFQLGILPTPVVLKASNCAT
jgi:hypothetical protein